MKSLIWLFPILFIFHDLEEIIFLLPWVKKNQEYLGGRFPFLARKLLPHFNQISTKAFALGVAEEFLIICIVTVVAYLTVGYGLWAGLFIAFTVHLIIHCIQAMVVGRYIPAVVTSILCLPVCIFVVMEIFREVPTSELVLYSVVGFLAMVVNFWLIHQGMAAFSRWESRNGSSGSD